MNFIPHLSGDSAIFQSATVDHAIYFYILANTTLDDTESRLVCKFSLTELPSKFKYLDPSMVKDSIKALIKEGLLIWKKSSGELQVGVSSKGQHKIFSTSIEDSTIEDYRKQLLDTAERFYNNATGIAMDLSTQNIDSVDRLLERPMSDWASYHFIELYIACYVSLYQVDHRRFTKKESGQMAYMAREFDSVTLFKMIVQYIFHSEKYHKVDISLGLFLYNKDKIYADVSNISKEKAKLTKLNDKKSEDYFS